jgi:hypothetical protein
MLIFFLSGAVTFGFLLAALFFFRFFRRTSDGLFFWFGLSFLMLATGQALVTLLDVSVEERSWIFLLRLAAYLIIVIAILRKNTRTADSGA